MSIPRMVIGLLGLALAAAAQAQSPSDKRPPEKRGFEVFNVYCLPCHGSYADGRGVKAKILNPPPANLTISTRSDAYKEEIIRKGGAAMGRSEFMPPWGAELTDQQISDIIAYLRQINVYKRTAPVK